MFVATSQDFQTKWDEVLHTAEMNLVQIFNMELDKVKQNCKSILITISKETTQIVSKKERLQLENKKLKLKSFLKLQDR